MIQCEGVSHVAVKLYDHQAGERIQPQVCRLSTNKLQGREPRKKSSEMSPSGFHYQPSRIGRLSYCSNLLLSDLSESDTGRFVMALAGVSPPPKPFSRIPNSLPPRPPTQIIGVALMSMRYPYPLHAHQIQGLHYKALYPVV
ncbi:hypothetical protein NE237_029583 [Protea cynaroides]|uniref:CCDC93 N-terminal domain-containing protein n=1 Tax=Protea cynaroides TaxID=273540 RepID=A0A9Q0GTF4_9MAGN|nr:hypothetical protein NE237_029583 [Protea cynaroides]